MILDQLRITPSNVERAAVMEELGIRSYPITSCHDLLNPYNFHALELLGKALGKNMFRLYTESRASTEPPTDTPFPDDIKASLLMKSEFLKMAKDKLARIEHGIRQGNHGNSMQTALEIAQSEGNSSLIDTMLERVVWGGADAIKVYSRLTQAARLMCEDRRRIGVTVLHKRPEVLEKPPIKDAIATAAYLLGPLVYDDNRAKINILFDQAAASNRLPGLESPPFIGNV